MSLVAVMDSVRSGKYGRSRSTGMSATAMKYVTQLFEIEMSLRADTGRAGRWMGPADACLPVAGEMESRGMRPKIGPLNQQRTGASIGRCWLCNE